ncbi:MAG: tRNA (adenosine(37)-N6)-threonylcarbamoyltransferase complex dimerization subunit type 1 TsaB [Dehalococcoidales bacterium]|nr:tRNA (adenosine(37)-N6)-threonylcarbamoyltransferase complex dimerization subunit type 1 TsaB [Dehalococcoidales bacterium]
MQVAIDTSTDIASLALIQDGKVMAELTWRCGQNHTIQLLPSLAHLLEQAGLNLKSAEGIIVAKGPGSYNGLRVGISTAKGLAFSLGIPLAGISTLEAEAYQYAEAGLPVCPIFNAGREEIATAVYQKKGERWLQLTAEHLTTIDVLCSEITTRTIFCGEFVSSIADKLKAGLKDKAIITSPVTGLRRAGFLAELGLKRLEAGDYDNQATLQPLYFRGPSITRPGPGKK